MEISARTWRFSGTSNPSKGTSSFCFISRKVAMAIGETLESVCAMQDKERRDLMEVLGLKVVKDFYISR